MQKTYIGRAVKIIGSGTSRIMELNKLTIRFFGGGGGGDILV